MNKSILESLINDKLEHSVCVAINSCRFSREIEGFGREYFVLIKKKLIKNDKYSLNNCQEYPEYFIKILNAENIFVFKKNQDKYKKVINEAFGRVYEFELKV